MEGMNSYLTQLLVLNYYMKLTFVIVSSLQLSGVMLPLLSVYFGRSDFQI